MPQFDPSLFSPQLFWLLVCFVTLYFLLSKSALPKIGAVLEERSRKIEDNLSRADSLRAEAQAAIATYEKALADSRARAQAVLKQTAETLAGEAEARHKALGERLAGQVKAGEDRIAAAKGQALSHVREVAAEVARAATARLTGLAPDESAVAAAIGVALETQR